jgi:hypothetical protein
VAAVAGDGQATVSWTPPTDNGGSAIIDYTVTANPGGATAVAGGGATSAVVRELRNGTAYTFIVHARNAVGPGPESAPSAPVTPRPSAVISQRVVLSGVQEFQNLTITSTGSITHAPGDATLQIRVAGTLQIDADGSIDVSGRGCPQSQRWDVQSAGCTTNGASSDHAGGSYGGLGGASTPNATYGDPTSPNELGSGGTSCCGNGSAGGGLVRITAGSLTLNGAIWANGVDVVDGAGSGGGIYLSVGTLSGTGTVSASGGSNSSNNGYGGGGGGRLALIATTSSFTGTVSVAGGTGATPAAGVGTRFP